jgi:CRP/FNR family transcriptional regulator, cyclic AMP receptor protein
MSSRPMGKILDERKEGNNRLGLVEFGGKRRTIYLDLVPDARKGDYVWFHAGFATERATPAAWEQAGGTAEPEDGELDVRAYRAYRLLGGLDPQQLRKLLPLAEENHFAAGEIIFRSGEPSQFLHLIVSGEVALEEDTGAQPVHIQSLQLGDAMGWSALTAGTQTHFRARALSRVSTIAFRGGQIRAACDEDPAMGHALMKALLELVTGRLDAVRMELAGRTRPD